MEKFKMVSYEGLPKSVKSKRSCIALNVMMFIFGALLFLLAVFL